MHSIVTTPQQNNLPDQALAFIRQSQAENKTPLHNELLYRCVAHLQGISDVSRASAERIAAHAMGEYECSHQREYIDIDASTGFTVFVRDPVSGKTIVFSAAGLMRIAQLCCPEQHHASPSAKSPVWACFDPFASDGRT